MPNGFLQGVQGAQQAFAPLIEAKQLNVRNELLGREMDLRERQADTQERYHEKLGQHYDRQDARLSKESEERTKESELSLAVRKFNLENRKLDQEEYVNGLKGLTEARKELYTAMKQPAGTDFAPVLRDLLNKYSHLGSSPHPQIRQMVSDLQAEAMTHMKSSTAVRQMNQLAGEGFIKDGETDPDRIRGAQTQKDLSEAEAYAAQNNVKLEHGQQGYELMEHGGLRPQDKAAMRGQVDQALKKRQLEEMAGKGNRFTITTEDENGSKTVLQMTPEQAKEHGYLNPAGKSVEEKQQAGKVAALESVLRGLLDLKARKVSEVKESGIIGETPSAAEDTWGSWGMGIDEAIDTIQERIKAARGTSTAPAVSKSGSGATLGTRSNPHPAPQSAEEFSKIPSGGFFINPPDGQIRIKR